MPYATDDQISQKPITGGVEISDAKYRELLSAQVNGQQFVIRDSTPVVLSETKRTVYSTEDGSEQQIAENAETPEGYTDTARPSEHHYWQDDAWVKDEAAAKAALKQYGNTVRDEREAGPFTINGYFVDTDPKSQSKLTGKALAVQAGLVSGDVQWRMADDVTYSIPQGDFMRVASSASAKVEAVYAFSWQIKAEIDAGTVTTTDEIDNADWPS